MDHNKDTGVIRQLITGACNTGIGLLNHDIALVAKAKPEFRTAAQFFKRFRDLTAGGFYTTPEGMKDIGYVGNVPTATFEGPTPEALKHLGLA